MTIFAASPSSAVDPRRRPHGLLAGSIVSALLLVLLLATPARGIVTEASGSKVGVQPRVSAPYLENGEPGTYANPQGNPVLHGSNTWVIFWDPTGDSYHGDWQNLIDEYMQASAAASGGAGNNVFMVDTQYTDKSNVPALYRQTFRGGAMDYHAYPTGGCTDPDPFKVADRIGPGGTEVCITGAQVAAELEAFISAHNMPRGMNQVYYVLTPPGVTMCLDGGGEEGRCSDFGASEESYENSFCSYHGAINPGGPANGSASTILYGAIPWTAGGFGDVHLLIGDRRPGWDCQDAGFNPANHEEPEGKPTEQEPHQRECPTEDGGCDRGLADLIINQLSMEQQNIVTDPLLNGWQDKQGYENTDECRFFFAPIQGGSENPQEGSEAGTLYNQEYAEQTYYLNNAFNFAAELFPSFPGVPCMNGIALVPRFTSPSPVNVGETIGFDGMESDITENAAIDFPGGGAPAETYPTYKWDFGDGTPAVSGFAPGSPTCEVPWLTPCAASVFHSYQYGGLYQVTLTVTDPGGNTAQIAHAVVVNGPPNPRGAGAGGGSTDANGHVVPAPLAAAAIVSRSLKKVLHKGLVVRYSVSEKVAGHLEVLLSAAVAKRLHVGGAPATGLPAGTPAQIVIAKAVIVTTKGGRSTITIKFSKKTAKRLSHLRSASLMLRMVVRNAASKEPLTTVVLSKATLSH